MKTLIIAILTAVLFTPASGSAQQSTLQSNDMPIELVQENEFVVKMMDVINTSGMKIQGLDELVSFSNDKKIFIFKKSNGKLRKVSDNKIDKISFSRVRQGVLTGKPASLQVNAWNGNIKIIELDYSAVRINDGYLFISQQELLNHFDGSDKLRGGSSGWSDKLHHFWNRTKEDSPEVFSTDFDFNNGNGSISRKMAASYCRTCLKIEILNLKIDPKKETILIRCKDVFYDKYNE